MKLSDWVHRACSVRQAATLLPNEASIKKILKITRKQFEAKPPPGFVWEPQAWYAARRPNRTQIQIGPSFFTLPKKRRSGLLRHEFGHDLMVNYSDWKDVLEPFKIGGSGAHTRYENPFGAEDRPEEIIADTYAALFSPGATQGWEDDKYNNLIKQV